MSIPAFQPEAPAVLGHYRILELIGAGGMGEVYRAHDERLDRDVALKLLPAGKLADERARARFRQEALSLSKVNHPNIAIIHDFGSDRGRDFLVMEYIPGTTLSDRVRAGVMPEPEVAQIGVQLAEGLAAAHEHGVIHRDLKPGNIRVTSDGRVKILDFGLAKLVEPLQRTDSTQSLSEGAGLAGTLPYMAPEQLHGQACDARTDIYGAGAVLYELATGRPLFGDAKSAELVDAIFHREPAPPRGANPNLSPAFEMVLARAVDKNPARRQQNARELLGELRALGYAGSASTSAATSLLSWWRWRIRRRYRAWLAAAALAMATLVVVAWFATRTPVLAFTAGDYVLLSDFENDTGDPVFDKSLSTAFATSLGQSAYANLYSRRRVSDVLKRMKRPDAERIDEALAQEIAVREGLKVVVLPSISGLGDNYRIAATLRNVSSGKDIRTEVVKARGKNKVLDAVDTLAASVRKDLGESLQEVVKSKPLSSVTTQSLDALRQYSIGNSKALALQWGDATDYFENALRIDPGFTAARASLGIIHVEQATNGLPHFDAAYGRALLDEAAKHVDGLTDREKYGILAFHARAVENNPEKSLVELKTLLALYPSDPVVHLNLGRSYSQMRRLPEAIGEYKEAIRLDPKFVLAYGNVAATYLYQMGEVGAAMETCRQMLQIDDSNYFALDCLGFSHFARNELGESQAAFEKAVAANPPGTLSMFRLAHVQRLQGHYQQALETLGAIEKADPSEDSCFYDRGVTYEQMGDRENARKSFLLYRSRLESHLKDTQSQPGSQLALAIVYARLGQTDRARQMLHGAMAKAPQLHVEAAYVLSLLGEKRQAVAQLALAIKAGYTNYLWLKMQPDLQPLHDDPEYQKLLSTAIKL